MKDFTVKTQQQVDREQTKELKEWRSPQLVRLGIEHTQGGTSNHPENVHPFGRLASV